MSMPLIPAESSAALPPGHVEGRIEITSMVDIVCFFLRSVKHSVVARISRLPNSRSRRCRERLGALTGRLVGCGSIASGWTTGGGTGLLAIDTRGPTQS